MPNSKRQSEDDYARRDWTTQHEMKNKWQLLSTVLRHLALQFNPSLLHSSHNHHLHSLGLGVVTSHWYNGTFPMWADYQYCTFQNYYYFNNLRSQKQSFREYLGQDQELWTMNMVKWHFEEWWKQYNITLFYGSFSGIVQSEQCIRENDT
jgi:hypothetical protein